MDVSIKDMRSIIETANDIRASFDKWHEVSGQMKLFYDQLCRLSDEHPIWDDKVNKFGLSNDQDLLQKIRDAQTTLDEEKGRLFHKNGRVRRFHKIVRWVFPAKLESSIRKVAALCEDLKRFGLTREDQIETVVRERALQKVPSFSFTSDPRYFPLVEMEEKVKKELRGKHRIVLLYGGSGTGKSALARNLALHFQKEAKQQEAKQQAEKQQGAKQQGAKQLGAKAKQLGAKAKQLGAKAKQLGAKAKQLGAKAKQLGAKAKQLGAKAKQLGAKAKQLGAKAKQLGAKAKQLGAKAKQLGAKAKQLGAKAKQLGAKAKQLGAKAKQLGAKAKQLGAKAKQLGAKQHGAKQQGVKQQEAKEQGVKERSGGPLSGSSQSSNTKDGLFKRVLYLECGKDVSLDAKQKEIVQLLDPSSSNDSKDANRKSQVTTNLLSSLLKERSLLIILDDVWKSETKPEGTSSKEFQSFLNGMTRYGGPRVRWFITSQSKDVCDHLHREEDPVCRLGMDEMNKNTAQLILQSLTGLKEDIPEIQDVMNRIIDKIGSNLYALTCVASDLNPERNQDVAEWTQLETGLLDALKKSEDEIKIHGIQSLSYWAATEFCFKHLPASQQLLLYLMQMCNGPSVSSSVIKYFFQQSEIEGERFSKARDELERKHLLTIKRVTTVMSKVEYSWSIHDLLKVFIEEQYGTVIDSKIGFFVEKIFPLTLETDVFCKIVYMYFNENCKTRIACRVSKTGILQKLFNTADLHKRVISPIIELLVEDNSDHCQSSLRYSLLQVIYRHINDKLFEEEHTSYLLKRSESQAAMLLTLGNSVSEQHYPVIGQQIIRTLFALLKDQTARLAESPLDHDSARDVGDLLGTSFLISKSLQKKENKSGIAAYITDADFRTILDRLTFGLLRTDEMNKWYASALANLAISDDDIKVEMIKAPNLLQNLGMAMGRDNSAYCQTEAARTLSNLATSMSLLSRLLIVTLPGMLGALHSGLKNPNNVELQKNSARTLANLANSNDTVRSKILTFEGVLGKLVSLMVKADNDDLKKQCGRALANLSEGSMGADDNKVKMVDSRDLLQNLVTVLRRDDSPDCQVAAARALSNLAASKSKVQIVNSQGVLEALRAGLENTRNIELQLNSACTVASLANSNHEVKAKIIACEGLLRKLVSLMVEVDNHGVNKHCGVALANLALGGDAAIQRMMATFPEIVDVLVDAMANRDTRKSSGLENGMVVLTLLSLMRAREMELDSAVAYSGRAQGQLILGHYNECLKDCDKAMASLNKTTYSGRAQGLFDIYKKILEPNEITMASPNKTTTENPNALETKRSIYKWRCCAKVNLEDFEGALEDADILLQMADETLKRAWQDWKLMNRMINERTYAFQERGVVKRMMKKFPEALEDLNASLQYKERKDIDKESMSFQDEELFPQEKGIVTHMMDNFPGALEDLTPSLKYEADDYEKLKHRGFVKFLLQDEEGARADAEDALRCKPSRVDDPGYGRTCLGVSSVDYLNFKLR